ADYHLHGVITEQSAVFEFETFNVVLDTFMTRLYRRFADNRDVVCRLSEFREAIRQERLALAEFNYQFFLDNLERVLTDRADTIDREKQARQIDQTFAATIERIKSR